MLGITINLLIGLPLVVGWPISNFDGFGFYACPMVLCFVEWSIMAYMAYQFKVLKTEFDCWPSNGWSFKNIEWNLVKNYLVLYFPSALALSSDFWRYALIGGICT